MLEKGLPWSPWLRRPAGRGLWARPEFPVTGRSQERPAEGARGPEDSLSGCPGLARSHSACWRPVLCRLSAL